MREAEEVFLVHRLLPGLDNLVLQCSDSQRALPTIWLRYVPSSRWQCPICSPLDPCMQIREPELEVCLVVLPCQPVYGCGVPLQLKEREPKDSDADVVEGRGEPFLFLRFAARRIRSCAPAQVTRFPRSVRGARLVGLHFLGPCFAPRFRSQLLGLVHRLPSYYGRVLLGFSGFNGSKSNIPMDLWRGNKGRSKHRCPDGRKRVPLSRWSISA